MSCVRSSRVTATRELLDRALGRPVAALDIDVLIRWKISELSLSELEQLEQRLTGRVADITPLLIEQPADEDDA
jgi:hypothetical protein